MRVYISGPISKDPDYYKKFEAAENFLKLHSQELLDNCLSKTKLVEIFNPAKADYGLDILWNECMKFDIEELIYCNAAYFLKGWWKSKGARLEHRIAKALDLIILYEGKKI